MSLPISNTRLDAFPATRDALQRKEYLMTPQEFKEFVAACNPPAIIVSTDPHSQGRRAQQLAREFWLRMAKKHRFDYSTVEPDPTKQHFGGFTAIPLPEEEA